MLGLDLPKRAGGKILSAMVEGKKQATWGGRFSEGPAELMLRIGESVSFDQRLAPFDVKGSKAQAAMLAHVGIITAEERDAIQAGLDAILAKVEAGRFEWDPALEDVHMNIEQALTQDVPAAPSSTLRVVVTTKSPPTCDCGSSSLVTKSMLRWPPLLPRWSIWLTKLKR